MLRPPHKVFLDANVVIQAGKPPGGPVMSRVSDLVKAGFIAVLTTDLTVAEVAKKHAANDFEAVKDLAQPHFRAVASELLEVELPAVRRSDLRTKLTSKYERLTAAMFNALKAKTLTIDDVKPSTVFTAYAEGTGFFAGEGKKDQFPDAFLFECLKAEASRSTPVVIVSSDSDFAAPTRDVEHIILLGSLPDLFRELGFQIEAPEIKTFLDENKNELVGLIDSELRDWGLEASDVEDADIEVASVTRVEIFDPVSFGSTKKGGSILVVGTAQINAAVAYTHPNWEEAAWDSEDKVLIPFEDVEGETEVTLEVEFSMLIAVDDDGEPLEFEEFRFGNDGFIYVDLHPHDPYG